MTKLRDCNADHSYPLAYRVCQALALLCRLPWALRFEDATEAIYQAEIVKETLRYWRFTLIFGCALVAFFTIWDANFFPQSQWRLLLLRMYIVIPILVAAASLTRLARGWNGQRMQSLLVAAVWHSGTGVTATRVERT